MRILIGSMMIFFGTLLMAGLMALGHPGGWGIPALDMERAAQQRTGQGHAPADGSRIGTLLGLR